MEQPDRSSLWATIGLASSALAMVAGYMSLEDLRYGWAGRSTTARVTDLIAVNSRQPEDGYNVWYEFVNPANGRRLRTSAPVPLADRMQYPHGRRIEIEYIPGDFVKSRIHKSGSRVWPLVLGLSSVATLAALITGFATRKDDEPPGEGEEEADDESAAEEDESNDEPPRPKPPSHAFGPAALTSGPV